MSSDDGRLLDALRPVLRGGAPTEAGVAAVRAVAEALPAASPTARPERSWRRLLLPLAAVLVLLAGVTTAALAGREPGTPEFEADLSAGRSSAAVEGRLVDFGRVVQLRSDSLPVLPKGEFYEVWFVAPPEGAGPPRRISAGTFHPDAEGRTDVDLFAAVDPAVYPRIEVTAEPDGGDPAVSGPVVLQGDLRPA